MDTSELHARPDADGARARRDRRGHRIPPRRLAVQRRQKLTPKSIIKDIRNITEEDLKGSTRSFTWPSCSNDPVGELDPERSPSRSITSASVELAQKAKKVGVQRFVYFSSCSVYGASSTNASDENGTTESAHGYAKCKLLVERDMKPMADDNFTPDVPSQRDRVRRQPAAAL